jgi:hypothetical protein
MNLIPSHLHHHHHHSHPNQIWFWRKSTACRTRTRTRRPKCLSENLRCDERESTIVINTEAPASRHVFIMYLAYICTAMADEISTRAKKIFSTQKEEPYMNMMSHVLLKKEFQQPRCRCAPHRRHICLCMYECVYTTTSEKPPKSNTQKKTKTN